MEASGTFGGFVSASGNVSGNRVGVRSRGRAGWPNTSATAEVRLQVAAFASTRRRRRLLKQQLLDRAVDEAQVVDAGVGLRGPASADEVRDRNGGQEADNCNHDHDFNEREARFTGGIDLHN